MLRAICFNSFHETLSYSQDSLHEQTHGSEIVIETTTVITQYEEAPSPQDGDIEVHVTRV